MDHRALWGFVAARVTPCHGRLRHRIFCNAIAVYSSWARGFLWENPPERAVSTGFPEIALSHRKVGQSDYTRYWGAPDQAVALAICAAKLCVKKYARRPDGSRKDDL